MLNINNLGHRTNVLYNSFFGEITEKSEYWVIQTAARPNFFWGNYILMKKAPIQGCYEEWVQIFEEEIGTRSKLGFMAIAYDDISSVNNKNSEFEQAGCKVLINKILTASSVHPTEKVNKELVVKAYSEESYWEAYKHIHHDPDWGYGTHEAQSMFLDEEINDFKKIIAMGKGQR